MTHIIVEIDKFDKNENQLKSDLDKSLKENGVAIEIIAKSTGLSIEEIQKL